MEKVYNEGLHIFTVEIYIYLVLLTICGTSACSEFKLMQEIKLCFTSLQPEDIS